MKFLIMILATATLTLAVPATAQTVLDSAGQPLASDRLSLSGKVPASRAVSFNATQIPQADFETFISCTGKLHGAHALAVRVQPMLQEPQKSKLASLNEDGRKIVETFNNIVHDLPIMAPHLTTANTEKTFQTSKAPFDALASSSLAEQEAYYVGEGSISKTCVALANKFVGLQSIYYDAQKSLE